jgi:FkbM family methyltransferase
MTLRDQTEFRDSLIDGVKPHDEGWLWPVTDRGLWSGPNDDWTLVVKPNILRVVPQRRVVVQAGGGCGMYPYLLSKLFESVYTFEPEPLNFYCLSFNCPTEDIYAFNAGVGRNNTLLSISSFDERNRGTTTFKDDIGSIPQLRIDQLGLPVCDLIFLDIEGSEVSALNGAIETINRCNPVIITELDNSDVENFMRNSGYKKDVSERQNTFWLR